MPNKKSEPDCVDKIDPHGYFAVANGREIGIFSKWSECRQQINGFPGSKFKKCQTREEAQRYIDSFAETVAENGKEKREKKKRQGFGFLFRKKFKFEEGKTQDSPQDQPTSSMYSLAWLERNLGQSETGLSDSEFAITLAELLASTRSSDDLQTELFDLLGFDRIELIQDVLEHRQDIVDSYYLNKEAMESEIANGAASIGALDSDDDDFDRQLALATAMSNDGACAVSREELELKLSDANKKINQLGETMQKDFECSICYEEMKPSVKIFQCQNGHEMCESCKNHPTMKLCPFCRQDLCGPNAMIRNITMEKLARSYYNTKN